MNDLIINSWNWWYGVDCETFSYWITAGISLVAFLVALACISMRDCVTMDFQETCMTILILMVASGILWLALTMMMPLIGPLVLVYGFSRIFVNIGISRKEKKNSLKTEIK